MSDTPRAPFGSWPRFYAFTCLVATLYIVLLYWFTVTFNQAVAGS